MTSDEKVLQDLINYLNSPAGERWSNLKGKLSALEHDIEHGRNTDRFVVVTDDGRAIEARNGALLLDVGDSPKAWTQEEAVKLATHWNSTGREAGDRAFVLPWREHAISQIERIRARLDAAEFRG